MKTEEFEFIGKSLYLKKEKILVIADLHIGYEEALSKAGVLLPRRQFKDILQELERIFEKLKMGKKEIKELVILGDLKHEFGRVSGQEWQEVSEFLDYLSKKVKKIILIRGNHDTILKPIARKKNLEIKEFYIKEGICFVHGHKRFLECLDRRIKLLILGHKHPAITIRKGIKAEIYKCFLVGKWKGKKIIILPSFFPLIEGSDVYVDDTNLAFNFNLKNFLVYVPVSVDEVLRFGKVRNIGRLS